MRLLWIALLLVPLAFAQGDGGRVVGHGSWSQFEPAWREGPAEVSFQGRAVEVPFGARYATDGAAWLYAADEPAPSRPGVPEHCAFDGRNGTWVLVSERACTWVEHPSVACEGTHACEDALGQARTPDPATTTAPAFPVTRTSDPCADMPAARCTPGAGAGAAVAVLAALALAARR